MYIKIQMEYFYEELVIYKEISYIHVDRYSKYRDEENPHTSLALKVKQLFPQEGNTREENIIFE
jgi:hypothetical protein